MKQLAIFLIAVSLFSCKQEEEKTYLAINGTIENNSAENVLIKGNDFEISTPISPDGKFSDTLNLKNNGLYQFYVGRERTEIYLEKGQNLTVNLNANEFDESIKFSGDLASANNYLAQKYLWNEKHLDIKELYSSDEVVFMKKINANQKKLDSLYKAHKISNENFKKISDNEETYSRAALIENYEDAHRYFSGEDNFKVGPEFYANQKNIKYDDTLAYRNSVSYQNLLDAHFNRLANEETNTNGNYESSLIYLRKVDASLPDGYAKDRIMNNYLQFGLKPDKNLGEAYDIYKNSNPDPKNLEKLTERYNQLKDITEGNVSPSFNYENHKGGTTSLADLKGKYVYIDVWATWCGPCLREIPALKDAEKNYQGKNIQFVSISIDEPKDYEKWKEMVTQKSLVGIQLMADENWKSQFVQDYAINGIPRFILIDPKGNIVSADAPRPSDPMLNKMLDNLL